MRKGDKRIFSDPKVLEELLAQLRQGVSMYSLAKKYNCNNTSINYQYKKFINGHAPKRKKSLKKYTSKEGACTVCELLFTSEYFCKHCKPLKIKRDSICAGCKEPVGMSRAFIYEGKLYHYATGCFNAIIKV